MSKLLPSNRKVRQLQGISLRNLAFAKPSRPRGQTIDDEQIPASLSSPAKLLAQKAGRLGHSQSFSDLKSSAIEEDGLLDTAVNGNSANGSPQKPKNKRRKSLRRRSTTTWSHATSEHRQKLLQDAVAERRVDSFFTLHDSDKVLQGDLPFYISEVKHKTMNVDFQHFDLSKVKDISRRDHILVRIWAARSGNKFAQLIEADVELPSLVWLGKSIDDFEHGFSENAIIFHLVDGIYTSMDYIPDIQAYLSSSRAVPQISRTTTLTPRETSSFDALMKLKDLTECIEDAASTQALVCQQIESIIQENKSRNGAIEAAVVNTAIVQATNAATAKEKKEVQKFRDEKMRRLADLQNRRSNIGTQRKAQITAEQQSSGEIPKLQQKRVAQDETRASIKGQIRRVAQELLDVFPIEPVQGHFLCFTICNMYLPNARTFEDDSTYKGPHMDLEAISAALGFVTHIIVQLELYLGIPLPYEPHVCGSTSSIFDPLSSAKELGLASSSDIGYRSSFTDTRGEVPTFQPPTPETYPYRSFPLYQQSVQSKRFRWAIYLLNKDIEELMQQSGCKVMDPRTTLANLKYLLSVLASGKGELPGRKVGVIKGLDKVS